MFTGKILQKIIAFKRLCTLFQNIHPYLISARVFFPLDAQISSIKFSINFGKIESSLLNERVINE